MIVIRLSRYHDEPARYRAAVTLNIRIDRPGIRDVSEFIALLVGYPCLATARRAGESEANCTEYSTHLWMNLHTLSL